MKVVLIAHIHSTFSGSSSTDVWMERTVELPCPPYIGLSIIDSKNLEVTITNEAQICYNIDTGDWKVYCVEDKKLYNKQLNSGKGFLFEVDGKRLAEIIKEYEAIGWIRRKK